MMIRCARHPGCGAAHAPSYWQATSGPAPDDDGQLDGDREVDIAIIGGGYTGCHAFIGTPSVDLEQSCVAGEMALHALPLRLTYFHAGIDRELAGQRILQTKKLIAERWRDRGGAYRLEVEMRVEAVQ